MSFSRRLPSPASDRLQVSSLQEERVVAVAVVVVVEEVVDRVVVSVLVAVVSVRVAVLFAAEEVCFAEVVVVYFVAAEEVYFAEAFVPYLEDQLEYREKVTRLIAEEFQILLVLFLEKVIQPTVKDFLFLE